MTPDCLRSRSLPVQQPPGRSPESTWRSLPGAGGGSGFLFSWPDSTVWSSDCRRRRRDSTWLQEPEDGDTGSCCIRLEHMMDWCRGGPPCSGLHGDHRGGWRGRGCESWLTQRAMSALFGTWPPSRKKRPHSGRTQFTHWHRISLKKKKILNYHLKTFLTRNLFFLFLWGPKCEFDWDKSPTGYKYMTPAEGKGAHLDSRVKFDELWRKKNNKTCNLVWGARRPWTEHPSPNKWTTNRAKRRRRRPQRKAQAGFFFFWWVGHFLCVSAFSVSHFVVYCLCPYIQM